MNRLHDEDRHEREMAKVHQEKNDYAATVVEMRKQLADSEDALLEFKRKAMKENTTIAQLEQSILELEQEKAHLEAENSFQQTIIRRALRMVDSCSTIKKGADAAAFDDLHVRKVIMKGFEGIRAGLLQLEDYQTRQDSGEEESDGDEGHGEAEEMLNEYLTPAIASRNGGQGGRRPGELVCDGIEYLMAGALSKDG